MKTLYQTIDSKIFSNINQAKEHEEELDKKAMVKKNLLKGLMFFKELSEDENVLVSVDSSFDESGCPRSKEHLWGNKAEIIDYISKNNKFWFYDSVGVSRLQYVNIKELKD